MLSEQRRDGENNYRDCFRFVPFSQQSTYPTLEEQLKKPKVYNIKFVVDFSCIRFPDLKGKFCKHCHEPFQRVVRDFKRGWGRTEQLNYIVPNTPQIICGCKLCILLEDEVHRCMAPAFRAMRVTLDVVEFRKDEDFATLKGLLPDEDYLKVIDFVDNFRATLIRRRGK